MLRDRLRALELLRAEVPLSGRTAPGRRAKMLQQEFEKDLDLKRALPAGGQDGPKRIVSHHVQPKPQ